jgi:Zn-dependent protease
VIFVLDDPALLLGMAIGLVASVLLHNAAQTMAARFSHDGTTRMARRRLWDPKREFDPIGVVVMIIAGLGWGRPVEMSEPRGRGVGRGRFIRNLLAGPAAVLAMGVVGFAGFELLPAGAFGRTVLGQASITSIAVAVLYLVPLPPLDGARIMWLLAPPTAGWQKARYYLEEQNYGLGILVLLLLPLFSNNLGLIGRMVYEVVDPILELVSQAV